MSFYVDILLHKFSRHYTSERNVVVGRKDKHQNLPTVRLLIAVTTHVGGAIPSTGVNCDTGFRRGE
jgi:hypothetical protein